jgi:hypothetical protein
MGDMSKKQMRGRIILSTPEDISDLCRLVHSYNCTVEFDCDGDATIEGDLFDVELFARNLWKDCPQLDKFMVKCIKRIPELGES